MTELRTALFAIIFGFALGLFYHAFFVLRILCGQSPGRALPARLAAFRFPFVRVGEAGGKESGVRVRAILLFLCDFLFAVCAVGGFFVFLYAAYDGVFRFFLLAASILGYLLYFLTLGRLLRPLCGTLAYLLRVCLAYVALAVRLPLALCGSFFAFALRQTAGYAVALLLWLFSPLAGFVALRRARRGIKTFVAGTLST